MRDARAAISGHHALYGIYSSNAVSRWSAHYGKSIRRERECNSMIYILKNLHKEESAQDLIEYGLVALIVALGALTGMGNLAQSINSLFSVVGGELT